MSETELMIRDRSDIEIGTLRANTPTALIESASAIATPLAELIGKRKLYSKINGRDYVRCEGWTTMGAMLGVIPQEVSNNAQDDGSYIAVVELVNVRTGAIMGRASAECGGPSEPMWQGRAPYARRSMASTRATAKAHRLSFSWIMSLAGYEATPAEEMEHGAYQEADWRDPAPRDQRQDSRQPAARGASPVVDGIPVWVGKLVRCEIKHSPANAAKPWTLHTFHGADGQTFGTFDTKVHEGLLAMDGKTVEIVYETTAKGNRNITEYRSVS